jgi:hypothetical protein
MRGSEEDFLLRSQPSSSERSSRSAHSAKRSSASSSTAISSAMSSGSSAVSSYSALSPSHCKNASPPTVPLSADFEHSSDDEILSWTLPHIKKLEGEAKKLQNEAGPSKVVKSHKSEGNLKKRRREVAASATGTTSSKVIDLTSDAEVVDLTSDSEPSPKRHKTDPEPAPPVVPQAPNLVLVHFHKVCTRAYIP